MRIPARLVGLPMRSARKRLVAKMAIIYPYDLQSKIADSVKNAISAGTMDIAASTDSTLVTPPSGFFEIGGTTINTSSVPPVPPAASCPKPPSMEILDMFFKAHGLTSVVDAPNTMRPQMSCTISCETLDEFWDTMVSTVTGFSGDVCVRELPELVGTYDYNNDATGWKLVTRLALIGSRL